MEQAATRPNDGKLNIAETFYPFFYGKAFPIFVSLIVALGYVTDLVMLSLVVISLSATFVFLFYKDVSPIIPLLFMVVLAFRTYDVMNEIYAYFALMPAISSFIARFFIHPIRWKKPGKLFLPLIIVTLAFSLGGVLRSDYDFARGIAYTVSLGPTMLVIYLFFYYNVRPKKGFSVKEYLCFSFVVTGLLMIFQMAFVRYALKKLDYIELFWGNINAAAAFLLLAIPACYYLIIKSKKITPLLIVLLALYLGVELSGSDATLGIVIVYSPFLMIFTYRNLYRKNRVIFAYSAGGVIILAATLIIILTAIYGIENALVLLNISLSGTGRDDIYIEAIRIFRENPLFGYGFGYAPEGSSYTTIRLYNFHSTLFHVMATMGVFGMLAYAFYFIMRFIILMKRNTSFSTLMLVAFIMYESYAMVDTGEFNAIPLMSALTVLITVVELNNKKGNANEALPLSINRRKGYNF